VRDQQARPRDQTMISINLPQVTRSPRRPYAQDTARSIPREIAEAFLRAARYLTALSYGNAPNRRPVELPFQHLWCATRDRRDPEAANHGSNTQRPRAKTIKRRTRSPSYVLPARMTAAGPVGEED